MPEALLAPPSWSNPAAVSVPAGGGGSSGGGKYTAQGAAAAAPAGTAEDQPAAAGTAAAAAAPLASCQLETRHWRILDSKGGLADTVSGDGVVGLFPLLVPDGEEFSYASCTPFAVSSGREGAAGLASSRSGPEAAAAAGLGAADDASQLVGRVLGAMEGSFSFVQGSMMQRMGPEFGVRCPRLVFAVPEYLY